MSTPTPPKKGLKQVPRDRVADGLYSVTRDTRGSYDECFVERLLEASSAYLRANEFADEKLSELYRLFKSSGNGEVNTTRMLKFHKSLVEANSPTPKPPRQLTMNFLDVLPIILVKNNPSEVSAALALLLALAYDDSAYKDLEAKRFNFPDHPMTNILEISRFYMISSKNYHIQETAKFLFISLVMKLCDYTETSSLIDELRLTLENLILDVKTPIVHNVIFELFDIAPDNCLVTELFQFIKQLLRRAFDESLEEQPCRSLVGLTRCMARAKITQTEILDKLKRTDNLEAIISYLTNINVFCNPSLFYFIMYPILCKCDSEDARLLESRLFVTRDEKYFIEKNLQDKLVQQCLTYIRLAAIQEHSFISSSNSIPVLKLNYSFEVTLEYLICNYDRHAIYMYKNLLECCEILKEGRNNFKRSIWLFQLIDAMFDLISRTDLTVRPQNKPILLQFIQILAHSYRRSTIFRSACKLQKIKKNWWRTMDLAYQHTDPDVLYEFANVFYLTPPDPDQGELQCVQFTRLIWEHMLPIAKDNEHHDLLGLLLAILMKIDLNLPKAALDAVHIKRYKDIPFLIGVILLDYSTVYTLTEKIIKCIVSVDVSDQASPRDMNQWARTKMGYLEWLDSGTLPKAAKKALDSMIKGICLVIRSDCDEEVKGKAMLEINSLISTLLINEDSAERLLRRLVRTGILEMIYVVCTCSLYPSQLQRIASAEIPKIKTNILDKFGTKEQIAAKLKAILEEENSKKLSDRAKEIANFYTSKMDNKKMKKESDKDSDTDRLGLLSYLNDILDHPRIDWGPSECY